MEHMLCLRNIFCPPGAAPPLRADCVEGGYEELPPVSEPPRVLRGLSRGGDGGAAPRAGAGEATTTLAAEQEAVVAPAPDGGVGGGAMWLALAFASVYGKVVGPSRS